MNEFLIVATIVVFLCGAVPAGLAAFLHGKQLGGFLCLANSLGAGVFLGAALIHLLGDAEELLSQTDLPDYPFPALFCTLGFMGMFIFDEFAHWLVSRVKGAPKEETPLFLGSYQEKWLDSGTEQHNPAEGNDFDLQDGFQGVLAAILLLIALGIHSFLAGVALGVQGKEGIDIFIAIVAHKSVASFVLCTAMLTSSMGKVTFVVLAFLFSCTTPMGVILGAEVLGKDESKLDEGIIIAVCSGIFLYVALVELMFKYVLGKEGKERKVQTIGLMFFGYAFMATIAIWT